MPCDLIVYWRPMLRGFIEQQRYPTPENAKEYLGEMVKAFDSCVDFLRDPKRFPNAEINKTATLMWRLIGNKQIPTILDTQFDVPSVTFAVIAKGPEQLPLLILPKDFIRQVQLDPVFNLGVIGYSTSQCRDFYCAKIIGTNTIQINARAQAFEAETLLTLQRMASAEGLEIELYPQQREYLARFPQGINSLPVDMRYSTPEYQAPPRHNNN